MEIDVLTSDSADALASFVMELSQGTTGIPTNSWSEFEASLIFSKASLTYLSILRYTPESSFFNAFQGFRVFDVSTQALLARSLLESYLALFYIAIEKVSKEEQDFRKALWEYQDKAERFRILNFSNPASQKMEVLEREKNEFKAIVEECEFYKELEPKVQKELIKRDKSKYLENIEISKRAGISPNYYRANFKHLSNFTHCSPMGVAQFDATSKKDGEIDYSLFFHIRNIASGIMSRAISDYHGIYGDEYVKIPAHILPIIEIWKGIHQWNHVPTKQSK